MVKHRLNLRMRTETGSLYSFYGVDDYGEGIDIENEKNQTNQGNV